MRTRARKGHAKIANGTAPLAKLAKPLNAAGPEARGGRSAGTSHRAERRSIVNGGYGIGIEHTTATTTAAKPLNTTHAATHTDSGTVLSSGLPARWSPMGAEYAPPAAPPGTDRSSAIRVPMGRPARRSLAGRAHGPAVAAHRDNAA